MTTTRTRQEGEALAAEAAARHGFPVYWWHERQTLITIPED